MRRLEQQFAVGRRQPQHDFSKGEDAPHHHLPVRAARGRRRFSMRIAGDDTDGHCPGSRHKKPITSVRLSPMMISALAQARAASQRGLTNSPINFRSTVKATSGTIENRSEEHTSALQSLMRRSYAVFCLKQKT